jgi:hypothetical protein
VRFEDDPERRDGVLPLVIRDPTGRGPSPEQELAFRRVRDDEAAVLRAVVAALFDSYRSYRASPFGEHAARLQKWLGVASIASPEGLDAGAGFIEVEFAREHVGGAAHVLFGVDCDWEVEHGMTVVYHPDRPATWTTPDALDLDSDEDDEDE